MSKLFSKRAFDRLKTNLNRIAKPSASAENIDRMIDASRAENGKAFSTPPRALTPGHSRGFIGEENREQIIQRRGEISLNEKLGVKGLTKGGIDGISIGLNSKRGMVLNLDENKAYKKSGSVGRASAIQENRQKNLKDVVSRMRELAKDKSLPRSARLAFKVGVKLAEAGRTQFRVQNAAGNSTGTTIANTKFDDLRRGEPKIELKTGSKSSAQSPSSRRGGSTTAAASTDNKAKQNTAQSPKSDEKANSRASGHSNGAARAKPVLSSGSKTKVQGGAVATSRQKPTLPAAPSPKQRTSGPDHQKPRLQPRLTGSASGATRSSHAPKPAPALKPASALKSGAGPGLPKSPTSIAASLSPKAVVGSVTSSVTASPVFAPGRSKM